MSESWKSRLSFVVDPPDAWLCEAVNEISDDFNRVGCMEVF